MFAPEVVITARLLSVRKVEPSALHTQHAKPLVRTEAELFPLPAELCEGADGKGKSGAPGALVKRNSRIMDHFRAVSSVGG
jgi:hypothetical protein